MRCQPCPRIPLLTRAPTAKDSLTIFPPFDSQAKEADDKRDSPIDFTFDSGLDDDEMASTQSPFIKSEPDDFNNYNPNQYLNFNNHAHMTQSGGNMNVNPANLTNGGNNFMTSSYIADDELADLNIDSTPQFGGDVQFQNFLQQQPMSHANTFSHTPDGAPIQSPFNTDFNYGQFRAAPGQQQFGHSLPTQTQGYRQAHMSTDRKVADSRSPATPNTPGMAHLTVSDDHPGMQQINHRQHNSMGNGWESTPSGHSWGESSPFPSPNGQPQHPQIEAVLRGTHHHKVASSLPTKMEPGFGAPSTTQEAKRRRRRESHNMVERRRRDNINERIQDLGTLVPQHRLEDEKVRKHLQTNAPLSPSIANAGMSPPNASLLGTSARRAAGNITQGLPLEDKDKGPNKGDILNGSVAWTRDMVWFMHLKLTQEQQLKKYVQELGGQWPFEASEEELRMTSEFLEVLTKHRDAGGFTGYTRAPGSGLRVPGFTNLNGDGVANAEPQNLTIPALSPGYRPGGSGMSSGMSHDSAGYNWNNDPKEEDEFGIGMEMQ
ncbi:hypothetical protein CERZMDRAFT_36331 [Cercospora zeae-maydis SCOH1-5]|uniref:BHLH domain-containing protein n=1 Tax=Cercospora zeae-maydis SCOH1-5 TaxID=717836 RepID=A0A6A6FNS3_9PEZI|nr:hypothetical protein CERZMDRAFT_36331 [Cercospora zeae-maydis SCOH1-5]